MGKGLDAPSAWSETLWIPQEPLNKWLHGQFDEQIHFWCEDEKIHRYEEPSYLERTKFLVFSPNPWRTIETSSFIFLKDWKGDLNQCRPLFGWLKRLVLVW